MHLLDFLFPKTCFGCKKNGFYICQNCIASTSIVKQKCIVCEKPAIDGYTHEKCKSKYSIDRVISIWAYEGIIRKALLSLKYKFASDIADELAQNSSITLVRIDRNLQNSNAVMAPIPLHWKRKNWRGFNQAEELGKRISQSLSLKWESNILVRTKQKAVQANLKADERVKNIEGVFSLNPNYQVLPVNKRLIMFDDVYTTGATLKEAGKVLKRGGARQVWAITIAR